MTRCSQSGQAGVGSDPISGDVSEVINFLAHVFQEGYQYRFLTFWLIFQAWASFLQPCLVHRYPRKTFPRSASHTRRNCHEQRYFSLSCTVHVLNVRPPKSSSSHDKHMTSLPRVPTCMTCFFLYENHYSQVSPFLSKNLTDLVRVEQYRRLRLV